jgi:hypothetical protein
VTNNYHLVKRSWIDRAVEIKKFHVQQLKNESNWTLQKTAEALNRSIGSISQDLLIASWLKTHDKQLRRCSSMRDALSWIRDKQREMNLDTID